MIPSINVKVTGDVWAEHKRYKVNAVVRYNNLAYQNVTGVNSIPDINSVNWKLIPESSPFTDEEVERLQDLIYKVGTQTLSVAPTSFEKGVATDVVFSWNVILNDDTLVSATLDGNDVSDDVNGVVSNYAINGIEVSKSVNLSTVLNSNNGINNLSNTKTSVAYIPQYYGKMVSVEPSYLYNDLQNFTKFLQSGDSKNVTDTFNSEYMFFISKKSNAVIKDGNDFVLTIGDFNSTTDFFIKKQVTVYLSNGNTETMYLYRTRETVNATVTFKIS